MIVAFAVDPEALSLPDIDMGERWTIHHRLLRHWTRHGLLIYAGDRFADSSLAKAVDALPVDLRKAWKTVFTVAWSSAAPGARDLAEVQSATDLKGLERLIDLACLEDTRALCVGLPTDRPAALLPGVGIEVCRLGSVDETTAFRLARDLANEWIVADTRISDLWNSRFRRMAQHARNASIVDRYVAQCHVRDARSSPLRRFLVNTDGEAKRATSITIFTEPVDGVDDSEIENSVGDALQGLTRGGIRDVSLLLIPHARFRETAHDRYLRFDHAVCAIGVGAEVLKGERVGRRTTFALLPHGNETRSLEHDLRLNAELSRRWEL